MKNKMNSEIIRWLYENMEEDDYGYWLPDRCVIPRDVLKNRGDSMSIDYFRLELYKKAKSKS